MTLLTARPIEAICVLDPAIDTASMTAPELRAYERERDTATLKFTPGKQPTRFMLRPLTKSQQIEIVNLSASDAVTYIRAFRYAVVSVSGVPGEGGRHDTFTPSDTKNGISPDELDVGPFTVPQMIDIGSVAWARSFLVPGNAPRFVLHPSLREHWEARPCLSAEQSAARQNKSKDNEMQASTAHAEASNAARSGSPTDAHATAETSPSAG